MMLFPIKGFGLNEGGSRKTLWWSTYIEELNSSNSSNFELMPTESGSVGKDGRCTSPVRNLVLDRIGSSYIVPGKLLYRSSNSEKDKRKPRNSDMYLYFVIIPKTFDTMMSYALWYNKLNGDCC